MDFKGKNILVYGAGKSGIGAAELLVKLGAKPVLFDQKEGATPESLIEKIGDEYRQDVQAAVGTVDEQLLAELDAAVLSPGVPTDIPEVIRLRESGIPVWGEVELAYRASRGTVLAVTGTNGKTTTTSILVLKRLKTPRLLSTKLSIERIRKKKLVNLYLVMLLTKH